MCVCVCVCDENSLNSKELETWFPTRRLSKYHAMKTWEVSGQLPAPTALSLGKVPTAGLDVVPNRRYSAAAWSRTSVVQPEASYQIYWLMLSQLISDQKVMSLLHPQFSTRVLFVMSHSDWRGVSSASSTLSGYSNYSYQQAGRCVVLSLKIRGSTSHWNPVKCTSRVRIS
jgi:hypothetical protein